MIARYSDDLEGQADFIIYKTYLARIFCRLFTEMLKVDEMKVYLTWSLHHFLDLDVDYLCLPSMSINNYISTVFCFSCHSNILLLLGPNVLLERCNTEVAEEGEGESCQR